MAHLEFLSNTVPFYLASISLRIWKLNRNSQRKLQPDSRESLREDEKAKTHFCCLGIFCHSPDLNVIESVVEWFSLERNWYWNILYNTDMQVSVYDHKVLLPRRECGFRIFIWKQIYPPRLLSLTLLRYLIHHSYCRHEKGQMHSLEDRTISRCVVTKLNAQRPLTNLFSERQWILILNIFSSDEQLANIRFNLHFSITSTWWVLYLQFDLLIFFSDMTSLYCLSK